MSKFKTEIIRQYRKDGRLIGAGLRWMEGRPQITGTLGVLGFFAVFSAASFVFMANAQNSPTLITFAEIAGVVAAGCFAIAYFASRQSRVLIFAEYGGLLGDDGQMSDLLYKLVIRRPWEVASIGTLRSGAIETRVVIYLHDGGSFTAARGLDHWQAHKIVMQLTMARDEILDATGSSAAARGRNRARQPID